MLRFIMMLLVLIGFFLPCSVWAAPSLVVEKNHHQFGDIVQGDQVEFTYRFQNAGDEVLEIDHLRTSCGCTAALLSARRIAPGMIGELKIRFDSAGFRGQVQKMVTFETSDPKHTEVTFILSGRVKAELFVQPQRINWGRVTHTGQLIQVIEVVNDSSDTIIFQPPLVTSSAIHAKLSRRALGAGETANLEVTAEFPDGKKRLTGYVILRSDFSSVPEMKVPVSARLLTQ